MEEDPALTMLRSIVDRVDFLDWKFQLQRDGPRLYLQLSFDRRAYRKWLLSYHMSRAEIVETCYQAAADAVLHEMRENFRYNGTRIHSPYVDPDDLVEIAPQEASLDEP